MDDDNQFIPITTDVEALVDDAEDRGYRRGLKEGEERGFSSGYRECGNDIIERLKTNDILEEGYKKCISEIEKMILRM